MIGEMALALVLLIGAGLMIRSFARAAAGPSGIRSVGRAHLPHGAAASRVMSNAQARLALLRQMDEQPARGSRA